jgi:DNA replication licensing factor MCM2
MSSPKRRRTVAESDEEDEIDDGVDEERVVDAPSDEEDGEDLLENAEADYQPIAELDIYDESMLDKRERFNEMTADQRREAEREMVQREQREGGLNRFVADGASREDGERRAERRNTKNRGDGKEGAEDDDKLKDDDFEVNLDAQYEGSLHEWISQDRTRQVIKDRFTHFLTTFVDADTGRNVHGERIRDMCARNLASLEVSYRHLVEHSPTIAVWLADAPKEMLEIFDEVANDVVVDEDHFPSYKTIVDEVHVRICDLPIVDNLRDLRQAHLNQIVRVSGVVTRRSAVYPQLKLCTYSCVACGMLTLPFKQNGVKELKPAGCTNCLGDGPFRLSGENTVYRNYQKITLQETPSSVPPGRVPRQKEVILLADLIDKARPGEEVEVIGIYMHGYDQQLGDRGQSSGFPVFGTLIEANHLTKKDDQFAASGLTDEDRFEILKLARDPRIGQRIVESLAPSIYGQDHVKMAVALALFGGCPKNVHNKHRIRGDINVLLLGDPGTAKSQILKYAEKIAPRAVYTTGKGASAVGLTAGVRRDPLTKEWILEGGALVLADRGLCLIDEFDKMSEQDRTSIHEAMEQQSISVSKAGIVTSLQVS